MVGNHPGEDVEAAGRALGIGQGGNVAGQRQTLLQRHDIDASSLENGTSGKRNPVEFQGLQAGFDRIGTARQERRPHPVGIIPEPEVEACRLDLPRRKRAGAGDRARFVKASQWHAREEFAALRHVHEPLLALGGGYLAPNAAPASPQRLNACGNRLSRWLELNAGRGPQ